MSEINTKTMSREDLESAAADLSLTFPHNISDDKLRAKIDDALGSAPAVEMEKAVVDMTAKGTPERRFEIIITTHDQDKQPVPVGINGQLYLIQRGKKVIVPESVVENLNCAVQFHYDSNMNRTELMSYPFQIIREV